MNKGFTLVELLAVIIILTLLIGMGVFLVNGILTNSRKELSNTQKRNLEKIAETYNIAEGIDNDAYCVSVADLLKKGYIEGTSVIDPKNKEEIKGYIRIRLNNNKYTYTYQDKECTPCELIRGKEKEIGSKYECEVKKGTIYDFYVLSTNEDGTTNLIMDSNINASGEPVKLNDIEDKGLVAWYDISRTNTNGPVTAMTYLHNATKDWANVPNIVMDYIDENIDYDTLENGTTGYGKIKTIGNVTTITTKDQKTVTARFENLKARLPIFNEINAKCDVYYDESNLGSCPLWLVNYLETDEGVELYYPLSEGKKGIDGPYGYWTLSSNANNPEFAWRTSYMGTLYLYRYVDEDIYFGVRPVITVKL